MQQSVNKPFSADESVGGARELEYILGRFLGRTYTATLVKVNDVQAGGTGPVGFLSATDLIQQVDGNNDGIPNVPMRNIPYFRLQGGANAIIIDPKPGDIGLAVFAQRDISALKTSKTEGAPPSLRMHDVSDGLYIGGLLNGAPSQWIQFLESGINVQSTGNININAGGDINITSDGEFVINSASFGVSSSSFTHNGTNIGASHVHPGIQPGGGSTGTPT